MRRKIKLFLIISLFVALCIIVPDFSLLNNNICKCIMSEIYDDCIEEIVPVLKFDANVFGMDDVSVSLDRDKTLTKNSLDSINEGNSQERTINVMHLNEVYDENEATTDNFWGNKEKQCNIDTSDFRDMEKLVDEFYTIDSNTYVDAKLLDAEKFVAKDFSIGKADGNSPQILIYHTHAHENFLDSVDGDISTTIVGVGEYLAQILSEKYGYNVLHHKGEYDYPSRDDAYSKALPGITELLNEYPSIEIVIDLHRDEMPGDVRLVSNINGKDTARLMYFNGLSRTNSTGEISYLENQYLEDNLGFSFQMQLATNEYYPGLARKIYLKGYRYNMHLCPKTLLVEMGAQNNTLEEEKNACVLLAHILDVVLKREF